MALVLAAKLEWQLLPWLHSPLTLLPYSIAILFIFHILSFLTLLSTLKQPASSTLQMKQHPFACFCVPDTLQNTQHILKKGRFEESNTL